MIAIDVSPLAELYWTGIAELTARVVQESRKRNDIVYVLGTRAVPVDLIDGVLKEGNGLLLRTGAERAGEWRPLLGVLDGIEHSVSLEMGWPRLLPTRHRLHFIHDMIPMIYPEFLVNQEIQSEYFGRYMAATRGSSFFVANTLNTKEWFCSFYRGMESRTSVVIPTPCIANSAPRFRIERPFFLALATLEPRKNLHRVIAAHSTVRGRGVEADLVLVGHAGWKTTDLKAEISSSGWDSTDGGIQWLGYVDRSVKEALLLSESILVMPSLFEGAGLPVAEAMQAGAPVVTSPVGGIPEVVTNARDRGCVGPVVWVDPHDVNGIANAMESLFRGMQSSACEHREVLGDGADVFAIEVVAAADDLLSGGTGAR